MNAHITQCLLDVSTVCQKIRAKVYDMLKFALCSALLPLSGHKIKQHMFVLKDFLKLINLREIVGFYHWICVKIKLRMAALMYFYWTIKPAHWLIEFQ